MTQLDLDHGFIKWKRTQARPKDRLTERRTSCPDCDTESPDLDSFRAHVLADASKHDGLRDDSAIEEAFRQISLRRQL
jgi:hypothetical protein